MLTRRDVLSVLALAAAAPAAASSPPPTSVLASVGPLDASRFHPGRALAAIEVLAALGKADGLAALRAHTLSPEQDGLFAVFRALIALHPGEVLRPPGLGLPVPAPPEDLVAPRFPVVLIGDVPLVLVDGYMLGGLPEPLSMHLEAFADRPWRTAPWQPAPAAVVRERLQATPWWPRCGVQAALLGQIQRYEGA